MNGVVKDTANVKLAGLPLVRHNGGRDSIKWYYQMDGTVEGYDKLRVSLFYSKGGTNWATGKAERRGYYVSVLPVSLTDTGYGLSESCTLFGKHGGKLLVEEANRFSAAKILTLQNRALEDIEPYARAIVREAVEVVA